MLEKYGFYVLAVGAGLAIVAFLWLVVRAFRVSRAWGAGLLIFPPLAVWFIVRHRPVERRPAQLLGAALLICAAPYVASLVERYCIPPPPYVQSVDGELRVTLTGVPNFDYATLPRWREAGVLQMANEDVDDRTLEHLRGFDRLHKLDVGNSQITDAGLAEIAKLPALAELYLSRTKITDAGFQTHLAGKESLRKLDFTGTEIKGKTKRDWKNQLPELRDYVD